MIEAKRFLDAGARAGFTLYTGVPCSYVKPFINFVIDSPDLTYFGATNEGDAIAIATGAELGGRHAVAMMQNSGLGNAVSPLTSLNAIFGVPCLVVVTLRGEPGGPHDEPQHDLMGRITTQMLELMEVGWSWFPREDAEVEPAFERAVAHMTRTSRPYAFVMKKDSVAPYALKKTPEKREAPAKPVRGSFGAARPSREEALLAVQRAAGETDVVIATTGYTGRELYACEDRENQLYVVGSMGCASSLALGLAWAKPDRRVIVLDGDGAALMRLGAFGTIAYERLPNLVHVVLDNEAHESTGAQSTVSHSMDLAAVAHGCGYPDVARIGSAAELEAALRDRAPGLRFLHVKTRQGVRADLPRPKVKPPEVAQRLRRFLA